LAHLTALDSTGVGHFIASYHKITAAGAEMRIAEASGRILSPFRPVNSIRFSRFT
jgi:hypothetical protein